MGLYRHLISGLVSSCGAVSCAGLFTVLSFFHPQHAQAETTSSSHTLAQSAPSHADVESFVRGRKDSLYGIDWEGRSSSASVIEDSIIIPPAPFRAAPRETSTPIELLRTNKQVIKEFCQGKRDRLYGVDWYKLDWPNRTGKEIPSTGIWCRGYMPFHLLYEPDNTAHRWIDSELLPQGSSSLNKHLPGVEQSKYILKHNFTRQVPSRFNTEGRR